MEPIGMGIFGSYLRGLEEQRRRQQMGLQNLSAVIGLGGQMQQQQQAAQMNPIQMEIARAQLAQLQNPQRQYKTVGQSLVDVTPGADPRVALNVEQPPSAYQQFQMGPKFQFDQAQAAAQLAETQRGRTLQENKFKFESQPQPPAVAGGPALSGKQQQELAGKAAEDKMKLEAARPQATQLLETGISDLERLASEAQTVKNSDLRFVTGVGKLGALIPGTPAANTAAKLQVLQSQIAFNVLQAMRAASKTGGALGQVSERELTLLQNNLGALSTNQSPEAMRQSLQQIIDYVGGAKKRLQDAYATTYGEGQQSTPQSQQRRATDKGGWSIREIR